MENSAQEIRCTCPICKNGLSKKCSHGGAGSGIYGLAFVGAVIYYIQHASTFGQGALGILKALAWPAMIVYKLLEFLKM